MISDEIINEKKKYKIGAQGVKIQGCKSISPNSVLQSRTKERDKEKNRKTNLTLTEKKKKGKKSISICIFFQLSLSLSKFEIVQVSKPQNYLGLFQQVRENSRPHHSLHALM